MVLDAHGRYGDPTLWFLFDRIEDANIAQSQLPGGYWIRAQYLPLPRRQRRLTSELLLYLIQDQPRRRSVTAKTPEHARTGMGSCGLPKKPGDVGPCLTRQVAGSDPRNSASTSGAIHRRQRRHLSPKRFIANSFMAVGQIRPVPRTAFPPVPRKAKSFCVSAMPLPQRRKQIRFSDPSRIPIKVSTGRSSSGTTAGQPVVRGFTCSSSRETPIR
jgi:hypothetical protein